MDIYKDLNITCQLDCIPTEAKNKPLDKETIIKQLSKTSSTTYQFRKINIELDDNCFLPKLSTLNELRRTALQNVEEYAISKIHRHIKDDSVNNKSQKETLDKMRNFAKENIDLENNSTKVSLLLNILNTEFDYSKLDNIDNLYIRNNIK